MEHETQNVWICNVNSLKLKYNVKAQVSNVVCATSKGSDQTARKLVAWIFYDY